MPSSLQSLQEVHKMNSIELSQRRGKKETQAKYTALQGATAWISTSKFPFSMYIAQRFLHFNDIFLTKLL